MWPLATDKRKDRGVSHSPGVVRGARRFAGPGIAVRALPGTKYLVYGLVVASGNAASSSSFAPGKQTVYDFNPDLNGETTRGVSTASALSSSAVVVVGDVSSVNEYDSILSMLLLLPLGGSVDERATVRGYTWMGRVPSLVRPDVWRLLCGYVPCGFPSTVRQQAELSRKRGEYENIAERYDFLITEFAQNRGAQLSSSASCAAESMDFVGTGISADWGLAGRSLITSQFKMSPEEYAILGQIALDLPRHSYALFRFPATAAALTRCLFLWSQRSPAVGYVQGIDDIMAVFFVVFLKDAFIQRNIRHLRKKLATKSDAGSTVTEDVRISATVVLSYSLEELAAAMDQLPEDLFKAAEADTYHCGGFFLSWLQDNFVHGQPGILSSITLMEKVLEKADYDLLQSLTSGGLTLMDCCFQWVHCLLARELPLDLLALLWERYMAIGNGDTVLDFHVYFCAALLIDTRKKIIGKSMDIVIQVLKDPLEIRASMTFFPQRQQKQERQRQERNEGSVYNKLWLEGLFLTASEMFFGPLAYLRRQCDFQSLIP